jgi:phage terminase Nu1 subunit (DNA packaging protein)
LLLKEGMKDATVTAVELAAMFGVTRQTIRNLDKRGILVRKDRGYARNASVKQYCAYLRDLGTGRGGESAIASATAERARLAKEQADNMATKNAALRGELLPEAEVVTRWSGILRRVQAGVLAAPGRCAATLPHLSRHDIAAIDSELRIVLTELGGSADDA